MSLLRAIWGLLFRLFPCPAPTGLQRVGSPGRGSPVLLTCNFDLTIRRLRRVLERAGVDAWLLVAESKGVNVWCAAGGDELNTDSVVDALKMSGVGERVDHRRVVLPPLGAPGICAAEVRDRTGWATWWGPVYAEDLPAWLRLGRRRRDEAEKRARYGWRERLDTALGSLFPFYLLGAGIFWLAASGLVADYLLIGAACFLLFFLLCPYLPGGRGLTKVLTLEAPLVAALAALLVHSGGWPSDPLPRAVAADLAIAIGMLALYAGELGGLASTMPSDLDPFLARLGVGAVGNVALAGTVRTELLNGYRDLALERDRCDGCRRCHEVCPRGVWEMDGDNRAVLAHRDRCTACRACLTQCVQGAITAPPTAAHPGEAGRAAA